MKSIIEFLWGPLLVVLGIIIYTGLKSSSKNDKTDVQSSIDASGVSNTMNEASTIFITIILVGAVALILLFFLSFF